MHLWQSKIILLRMHEFFIGHMIKYFGYRHSYLNLHKKINPSYLPCTFSFRRNLNDTLHQKFYSCIRRKNNIQP